MPSTNSTNHSSQARAAEPMIGRRSAPRLRLAVPTKCISLFGEHRCILIDVSRTGAQLSLEAPLPKGECAIVQIDDIELFGCINRCDPGKYGGTNGVEFDEPISNDEVLQLRTYAEGIADKEKRELFEQARKWVEGH